MDSILSFSTLPMHLMTVLGLGFAAVSAVLTARTLWLWAVGEAVPGITTVILLLIMIGAILMIGLGIIGAYIARIYDEVKNRPRFVIQEDLSRPVGEGPGPDRGRRDRSAREAAPEP